MYKIDSKKLEQCMISLFFNNVESSIEKKIFNRTRYLSTNGSPIKDAIAESVEVSDEVIKLIDEVVLFNRLLKPVKFHKSNWPKNPIVKDPLDNYAFDAYRLHTDSGPRTSKLTHTEMIVWSLASYLTKYVNKSDYKDTIEFLLLHEKSLTPYVKFMEITGVCRVYLPSDLENVNKEVHIEASHPLTHPQEKYILDYININNIPSDKIYVDDHSKEQCIKRQLGVN